MIKAKQEKVKKFYEVISRLQFPPGKEIGMIIVNKETMADIAALAPNSNLVTGLELTRETDVQEVIEQLADAIKAGRVALIRLHEWLDPKIYNQLFLLSKNGRMEFPDVDERVFVEAPKEAMVILVCTDAELAKLNYENIFDLIGPVERL
ncbi:MAG: hypothetical protein ABII13_00390 [Patescibacteria group bacterium]|nr:hypothetical protein [Patescibacteria group bacterium]MBU2508836.1 hypothetical protein [Patescibacteria group bacterium]